MKKILLSILSFNIFIFSYAFLMPVSAFNNCNTANNIYSENEFIALNNEIESYNNLKSISTDSSHYNELVENKGKFKQHIYSLKAKKVSELKEMNYTDSQISAIKNYDGSDELSARAAATVRGTLSVSSFKYNSSTKKTNITAKYTVKWNGTPYFKYYDVMAIAIAGSEKKFMHNGSSFSCNKVIDKAGTNASRNIHNGAGVSYKFNIADKNNSAVFSSATVTYKAIAGGKVSVAAVEARYAHWQLSASPEFSISTSGISIGFKIGPAYNTENKRNKTLKQYI